MTTSINEAPQQEPQASSSEEMFAGWRALEKALHLSDAEWGSEAHNLGIAEVFKSPLYSDECKEFFAADALRDEFSFLIEGEFLTEEIIFSFIKGPKSKVFSLDYFAVLMGSQQLSERIVSAAVRKMDIFDIRKALELIPDSMITSAVIISCLTEGDSWIKSNFEPSRRHHDIVNQGKMLAVLRVKQAHPEYAEFPDDWVLKAFCGE